MSKDFFYKDLPYIEALLDIQNKKYFHSVPLDWHVVITDVVNSTQEIDSGKYKEINVITAATIAAILNIDHNNDIPFVYGGDGTVMLVPGYIAEILPAILHNVATFASETFNQRLRIGIVPVIDIIRAKRSLTICKIKINDAYFQPVFHGDGVEYAEYLVRNSTKYQIEHVDYSARAQFEGLQCVWQQVNTQHEEVVSVLVKPHEAKNEHVQVYQEVLQLVQSIYGPKDARQPVKTNDIHLRFNIDRIKYTALLNAHQHTSSTILEYSKFLMKDVAKLLVNNLKLRIHNLDAALFKDVVNKALESEKVDNMLKMVLAGSKAQRIELEAKLKEMYQAQKLVYGTHVSDKIYLTCFIHEKHGNNVQFIDGSNGGYTVASKDLKNRLKWWKKGVIV